MVFKPESYGLANKSPREIQYREFDWEFKQELGVLLLTLVRGNPITAVFVIVEADGTERDLRVSDSQCISQGEQVAVHIPPCTERVTIKIDPPSVDQPVIIEEFDPQINHF